MIRSNAIQVFVSFPRSLVFRSNRSNKEALNDSIINNFENILFENRDTIGQGVFSFFLNESYFLILLIQLLYYFNLQQFLYPIIVNASNSIPENNILWNWNKRLINYSLPCFKREIHRWIKIHNCTIIWKSRKVSPTFGDDQPRNGMYSKRVSTERNVDTRIKHEPACLPTRVWIIPRVQI